MSKTATRLLHTMIRVKDLEKSIQFYGENFGLDLIRKRDFPDAEFTLAYLGAEEEEKGNVLELTYNWHQEEDYSHGSGYGHIAFGCEDLYAFVEVMKAKGVTVTREPGPMLGTEIEMAFVEDPDGYKIELLQLPFPAPA
ncbi:lactoylglutathione lyase [Henriciella litoralis]|uniref:lactoylglutathione lyase n=1 Tax=Henriciella litoralis TaxID=568102 RepID=UPI000A060E1D|nr:lactoylglutathione lyase [Henriciella litoralis]